MDLSQLTEVAQHVGSVKKHVSTKDFSTKEVSMLDILLVWTALSILITVPTAHYFLPYYHTLPYLRRLYN